MSVFVILKSVQCYDSDGWDHWVTEEPLGIYSTGAKANEAIKKLCEEDAESVLARIPLNPWTDPGIFEDRAKSILLNRDTFQLGTEPEFEELDIFKVKEIPLDKNVTIVQQF